jgi:acyl phosphate:glycerol-3-phosphate acyltransferase
MSWMQDLRSANWNQAAGLCLFAYILGCITAGYYLVRLHTEQDIRLIGSGSVGARNVSRVLGKPGFFLTLLFDFGKGALVVWTVRHFTTDDRLVALSMLAVVAGHIWPAQLRFRGGKGMATFLGAFLVYDPQLALTYGVLFLCLSAVLRRIVVPAACALACLPLASVLLGHSHAKVVLISILAGLVLIGHRKNLAEEFSQWAARRHLHPKTDQHHL